MDVLIGLVAIFIGWRVLPRVPVRYAPRPNLWPALLVTGGIAALTFAIVRANDWGWASPSIAVSFALAVILLALFVHHCLRSANPFVDPALFRVRPFTGAALAFAPYGAAFGAMLLSISPRQQTAWGWSALKTGLGIAPGPLLVPITSLLFAGRLIARFGAAAVATAGAIVFAAGPLFLGDDDRSRAEHLSRHRWDDLHGRRGRFDVSDFDGGWHGIVAAVLVRDRLRRDHDDTAGSDRDRRGPLVAIVGMPGSLEERIAAYHRAWWVITVLALFSIIPNQLFIGRRRPPRRLQNRSAYGGDQHAT